MAVRGGWRPSLGLIPISVGKENCTYKCHKYAYFQHQSLWQPCSCMLTHLENLATVHLNHNLGFHTTSLLQKSMLPVHTAPPIMSPYIPIWPASTSIVPMNTPLFDIN